MYCSNCGQEASDGAQLCSRCGQGLSGSSAEGPLPRAEEPAGPTLPKQAPAADGSNGGSPIPVPIVRPPPVQPPTSPPAPPGDRGQGQTDRPKALLIGGGVVAVVAVIAIVYFATRGGGEDGPPLEGGDSTPSVTATEPLGATQDPVALALDPDNALELTRALLISRKDLPGGGWTATDVPTGDEDPLGYDACRRVDEWSAMGRALDAASLAGEAGREFWRTSIQGIETEITHDVAIYETTEGIEELVEELERLGRDGEIVACFDASLRAEISEGVEVQNAIPVIAAPEDGAEVAYVARIPGEAGVVVLRAELYLWSSSNVVVGVAFFGLDNEVSRSLVEAGVLAAAGRLEAVIADPEGAVAVPTVGGAGNEQFMLGLCVATSEWEAMIDSLVFDDSVATEGLEATRDEVSRGFSDFIAWTRDYRQQVESLQPPDFSDGVAFQQRYVELLRNMEQLVQDVVDEIDALDASDPEAFHAGLERLVRDMEVTLDDMGVAFDSASHPYDIEALDLLAETIPECQEVDLLVDDPATPTPPAVGEDPDGDLIVEPDDACPEEPENVNGIFDSDGCPDTLDDLIFTARTILDEFWAAELAAAGLEYQTAEEFVGYTTPIDTACGEAILDNAFYCSLSHGVYYDENLMQEQLDRVGDFAPVFILAHEWGHLVQGLTGAFDDNPSIIIELQADCFAGAFTAYVGQLGLLDEGDIEEAATSLFLFGDRDVPVLDPEAHGSPGRRIDAFDLGLRGMTCAPEEIEILVP